MEHYKRGTAIIFNHYEFDYPSIEKREGTEKDVEALTEVFKSMLLDVCVCEDYTYGQVYDKLNEGRFKSHIDLYGVIQFSNSFFLCRADIFL